ncbi:hypothetical protein [Streptosporangium sp. NBC_01469]|uniref:hypothetical protein n=1 Tax=Streptosporangium sp. NBC_01469 TaxID=2903898 RepID=UPI002E2DD881|nr:hypothetical protein [Streptosporangium sp. NBC_01469]
MKSSSDGTLTTNLHTGEWDFGDFPYGLEPLTMPPVGHNIASSATTALHMVRPYDQDLTLVQLRLLANSEPLFSPATADEITDDQLFWFRWITGHQISFLIWHLMGKLLKLTGDREAPDRAALAKLETYTHGYSAMLLYTGSCPLDLYQTLIRPRMFLQHRSFSGAWASDFGPVRSLFRGRGPARGDAPEAVGLAHAVAIHKVIHDGVAARLVPGKQSLLQQAMAETVVRPSERMAIIYDNFFLTLRAPIDHDGIAAQLLRRLRAVAQDVASHGLYPVGRDGEDRPEELLIAEMAVCEKRIGRILHEVAEVATTPAA